MWEHCGVAVCAVRLVSEGRGFEANLVRMPRDKVLSVIVSLKRRLILTNQNRALRTCVWFFWFAFKRKFYATGPIPGGPKNPGTVDFLGLCSDQQLSFSPCKLLDRTSFPHYNNTKIIKFGWKLFVLWVISYGLSFSGFAINFSLVGGPPQNGTVNFFRTLLDEQLVFSPCWIEHLFLIIMTPRSSNLVENFSFYE